MRRLSLGFRLECLFSFLCQFMFWVIFYFLCYLALNFCELIKRCFFYGQSILLRYIIPSSIDIFYELNPFPWRPWITMINRRGQFHAMLLRHFPFTNKSKVYIVVCVFDPPWACILILYFPGWWNTRVTVYRS